MSKFLMLVAAVAAFGAAPQALAQQDFPNKAVRLVIPYPPGRTDRSARAPRGPAALGIMEAARHRR